LLQRLDALRQTPGLIWELRPLQDGEGGFEANGGGRSRVVDEIFQRGESAELKVCKLVAQEFRRFLSNYVEFRLKLPVRFKPIMDGGAMDTGGARGVRDGLAASEGGDDLDLNR
jgi:hypothetical protein